MTFSLKTQNAQKTLIYLLTILTKTEWIKEHIEGDFQKEEEVSKNKKQKEYETTV